ncbi:hypothetical protein TIFTF001_007736 [Ficus carica]|uniref:Uncharacterized protein n=1 Tax=Ficus carica TaxID=3494 RepID=A0AA88DGL8_FICCA|nr:hypothetical protein TIFTF001_007736 [Ficus carica]
MSRAEPSRAESGLSRGESLAPGVARWIWKKTVGQEKVVLLCTWRNVIGEMEFVSRAKLDSCARVRQKGS